MLIPTTLQSVYALAKVQDALWNKRGSWDRNGKFSTYDGGGMQKTIIKTMVNANLTPNHTGNGLFALLGPTVGKFLAKINKKLSDKEMDECSQCFWYQEKYVPRHRCYDNYIC